MKNLFNRSFVIATGIFALASLGLIQPATAQRFNHGGGGAPAPAARPAMTRPTPVARPEASRPNPPAMRPQQSPAPRNPTINGGSRNIGNHDFSRNNTARIQSPQAQINTPARPNNPVQRTEPNPRPGGNDRGNDRGNGNGRAGVPIHDNVNVFHTGGNRGMRPYANHPYHPYYWGPRWHPFGFFLSSLAANAFRFNVGGQNYYYDDGSYYVPSGAGYSSVPPPIGAVVSYLPDGYETTMVGNDTLYYYAGAFYVSTDQGYQVVQAPIGAVVGQLPDGAVDQQVNGEDVLVYNNVYYQPITQDGQDAYQVVQ
jgi:hypothetical protein